jgi:hypothetical protein
MVLTVKGSYLDLIRSGRKTSTIRLWDVCRIHPGGRLTFTNYRDSVRTICASVECVRVEQLSANDARTDGFDSLRELLKALRKHYPTLTRETRVWVVHFALLNDSAQSARATD